MFAVALLLSAGMAVGSPDSLRQQMKVLAEPITVELDPARTTIAFSLHSLLHTVHGTFRLKRGTIHLDASTGEAGGEIVIDVAGGQTGNQSRDRRMHREVLESQAYPEAVFVPTKIVGHPASSGASRVEIQGRFKIHGTEHDLTLRLDVEASGEEATAAARFTIPYVQWGMKDPSNLLLHVDDHVDVQVRAVGRAATKSSE